MTTTENRQVVLNETVTHVPNYNGHWKGEAYLTHHTYGEQVHRHSDEAARWNESQKRFRPAPNGATCPDCERAQS